jgi:multiple RNA-binding domain-containing protein 1
VKVLPKHITQERFLEVFAAVGEVTDVKLLKTKYPPLSPLPPLLLFLSSSFLLTLPNREGQKRNMGFVGFRNEEDATNAIKLLHNTYIDTSRIQVELAKPVMFSLLLLLFLSLSHSPPVCEYFKYFMNNF